MKLKNKIVALALVVASAFGLAVSNRATKVEAANQTYTKVTEAPTDWSGSYLIVYEAGSRIFNSTLTTLDATNNYTSVTISDNSISVDESYAFTIATVDGGYSIKSSSGYFIGHTADANKLSSSTTTEYVNTISLNNDGTVNIIASGKPYLRYNATSGQDRFRYFKSATYSNQKAICLYKLNEGASGLEALTTPTNFVYANQTLTWDEVANAGSYSVNINGNTYETDTNSYVFSAETNELSFNTEYEVKVTAVPANSEQYNSSEAGTTTITYVPTMEEVEAAAAGATKVQLGVNFLSEESQTSGQGTASYSYSGDTYTPEDGDEISSYISTSDVFDVYVNKNSGSNMTALRNESHIRLQASNDLTFTGESTITAVSITYTSVSDYPISNVKVTGDNVEATATTTDSTQTYTFENGISTLVILNNGSKQVRITNITITYEGTTTITDYTYFADAKLRFVGEVPADVAQYVDADEAFGVTLTIGEVSKTYTLTSEQLVTEDDGSLSFAVVLTVPNIVDGVSQYDVEVTGQAFFTLTNGTLIELTEKTFSVNSLLDYYLNKVSLSVAETNILTSFQTFIADNTAAVE